MELNIIKEARDKFGSPLYIFDLDKLKERVMMIKERVKSAQCCYAMKANPFLIKPMNEYVDKYEVCSPGEYEICHRMGIDPKKIVVSGVNKTHESMDRIMKLSGGKGIFTIESEEHYDILSKVCAEQQTDIKVIIRLSSGNQFGVDKDTFEHIASEIADDKHLELYGLHYYSGTQKKLSKVEKELAMLDEYAGELKEKYGFELKELEYGPGLPVTYFESDKPVDEAGELDELADLLDKIVNFRHITIEMGRYIATCCGYYITSVMDVKHTDGVNYAIVDGGIHQLNYYGQSMGMKKPHMKLVTENNTEPKPWNICGSLCTVNDVILRGIEFTDISKGDFFVFESCGAYSVTECMALFLSRELPQIVFYSDNSGFTVARKPMGTDVINSQMEG